MTPPDTCPNCGADVPPNARACPECGSDETTGWSETAYAGRLGLPDDDFHYDDFAQREFGRPSPRPRGIRRLWWIVALLLIVAFLAVFLRAR